MDIDNSIRDAAEHVAALLEGSIIFYSEDGAGAVVMVYNSTEDGGTYVVDIDENGHIRSGTVDLETGWDA